MTTANKITILRMVLVPVLVILMYLDFPGHIYWALAVFIIASISDFFDGYIARHYNRGQRACDCRSLVRQNQNCKHHGGYHCDDADRHSAQRSVAEHPRLDRHRYDDGLLRRGILL